MASVNDRPLLAAQIVEPFAGAWVADVTLGDVDELSGPVTIDIEGVTWKGTVFQGGAFGSTSQWRIIAGNGKLASTVPAQAYVQSSWDAILSALIAACGESPASDSTASGPVAHWARLQGFAGSALSALCAAAGAIWRIKRDGTLWAGPAVYSAFAGDLPPVVAGMPALMRRTYAPETPLLEPGMTLDGWDIDQVLTLMSASKLRQEVYRAIG